MTFFKCSQGHVIGEVRRINKLHRLLIFDAPPTEQRKLKAIITGSADLPCSVCGEYRHWQVEDVLIDRLIYAMDS